MGSERLAFDLALRALAQQEAAVNELRSRTGTLLAASSVATSFLAPRLVDPVRILPGLALAAFLVSFLASAYVLFPRGGLAFAVGEPVTFEQSLREQYAALADSIGRVRASNQLILDEIARGFGLATLALVAEAMLLTIELARR